MFFISTFLLFFGSTICFHAANAVPLQGRKAILPTRATAPDAEFNGFFIAPSGSTAENEIPKPPIISTSGDNTVSPDTTVVKAPSPIRTLGVLPPADPEEPFSLFVTGTVDEMFSTTAISTTSFEVSSSEVIQPTPTETSTKEQKGDEVSTKFQPEPTVTETGSDLVVTQVASYSQTLKPSTEDIQPTPTETSVNELKVDEVTTKADATAAEPTFGLVTTQVASYSQTLQPSTIFTYSSFPTTTTVAGESKVIRSIATDIANAPTGIVSPTPTGGVSGIGNSKGFSQTRRPKQKKGASNIRTRVDKQLRTNARRAQQP